MDKILAVVIGVAAMVIAEQVFSLNWLWVWVFGLALYFSVRYAGYAIRERRYIATTIMTVEQAKKASEAGRQRLG
jgi:hypothetical protein